MILSGLLYQTSSKVRTFLFSPAVSRLSMSRNSLPRVTSRGKFNGIEARYAHT
uniref:Uncharacterized protein n=1 Tax=Rhizophora mucronata TaxID=61149 RepID=A0A2P2NPI0_RHIMU